MTDQIIALDVISADERRFVAKLRTRVAKLRTPMRVIKVALSEHIFETAQLQGFDRNHLTSPFGSKEHFEKVMKKHGWKTYEPYLTGKTQFYLRVKESVPAKIIH
jgi:hypothetical protein